MQRKTIITVLTVLVAVAIFYRQLSDVELELPTPVVTQEETLGQSDSLCEVFFTNPAGQSVDVRHPEEGLIELIDSSTESIDMAVFEFNLQTIKNALVEAKNRGVEIRVVYDDEYSDEDPDMAEFLALGVPGIPDERSALMHNKFLVIDREIVWTGSFNLTENAAHRNNENAMRIESPELATYYTDEFEKMFSGDFGPHKEDDAYPPLIICGDAEAEVYFAPDGPKAAILGVLESAESFIHVMAFSLTDDDIGQIMVDKADGLDVGAIFERTGSGTQYSEFDQIVAVTDGCTDTSSGTFHHKVIVIDGTTVIFGSYNFSASAEENNDENMLVIVDPEIAMKFEEEYQRRLEELEALGLCVIH